MTNVEDTLSRLRRDLTFSAVARMALLGIAVCCILLGPLFASEWHGTVVLVLIGGVWLVLSYRSLKGSQLAARAGALIASGRLDEAERQIETALASFSLFRAVKLLSLHHLAMLRHTQRRWQESATLCRALLRQRLGALHSLSTPSRLMLAESLLETGDLNGAYQALAGLYAQRLSLAQAMELLKIQSDYLARLQAWDRLAEQLPVKVQLAELMPTEAAARTQALLALAARKTGRGEWAQWLKRRVELLTDVTALARQRPALGELWTA